MIPCIFRLDTTQTYHLFYQGMILGLVKGSRDVVEAVQMLIDRANSNGGRDNIGVVLAEPIASEESTW